MLWVTEMAANWFTRELHLQKGQAIRFFVRYGAQHQFQTGYALGITVEKPHHEALSTEVEGIQFFITEDDVWYLDGHSLVVSCSGLEDDIRYECFADESFSDLFAIA